MTNLTQKRAYITGGTSGIGRAIAEHFIEQGARVVIADITDGTQVAKEIGAHYVSCNVANEQNVSDSLVQATELLGGKLDIVVLNAGVGDVGFSFEETEQSLLEKVTKINQWSVLYGLKHAPKNMNDGGSIINTSSMASVLNIPGTGVYSAGKRAILSMTEMSALELGSRNIRVNAVCPGYVNTPLGDSAEERRFSELMTALGRHGDPKTDIAPVYGFLASQASQYVTGQYIKVDGGMDLGPTEKLLELVTGSVAAPGKK
ncbi:MAG: SDR family oxidoreductase [Colwellia sp.]|jgi:Dehydrogenases with different specificities (related to short-chain alcohol dehydrogenases)